MTVYSFDVQLTIEHPHSRDSAHEAVMQSVLEQGLGIKVYPPGTLSVPADLTDTLCELHSAIQHYDNTLYNLQPKYKELIMEIARLLSAYYEQHFIG